MNSTIILLILVIVLLLSFIICLVVGSGRFFKGLKEVFKIRFPMYNKFVIFCRLFVGATLLTMTISALVTLFGVFGWVGVFAPVFTVAFIVAALVASDTLE